MHKYAFALLAVTIPILPLSLMACDCDDDNGPGIVHFKDGLTPNGPVKGDGGQTASDEGGCTCSAHFAFRDYGPAQVTPPPAPVVPPRKVIGT